LIDAFERAAQALPFEDEFRDIEVVAHKAVRHGRTTALTLIVDRSPAGIDLELCGRVARRLNAVLETETEAYTLEVESPGLDRPLLRPADYERFRGRAVRVVTTEPVQGSKTHRGTLAGVRGLAVVLTAPKGAETLLPLDAIKSANLEFDPREDLRRAKLERREAR
jgi:ribosome maturation factor RimP